MYAARAPGPDLASAGWQTGQEGTLIWSRVPHDSLAERDYREPYLASAQVRPCVHYPVGTAASANTRASDQQIALILRKDRAELADLCLMHLQIQIVDRRK